LTGESGVQLLSEGHFSAESLFFEAKLRGGLILAVGNIEVPKVALSVLELA
jgi:hypothetical protein